MLLVPANGTEVGCLPIQASKLEQALRHAHRLVQGQVEQALDHQAQLNRHIALLRAAASLVVGTAMPAHARVRPDKQGATRLQRCVVVFQLVVPYFGSAGAVVPSAYLRPHPTGTPADLYNKANHTERFVFSSYSRPIDRFLFTC